MLLGVAVDGERLNIGAVARIGRVQSMECGEAEDKLARSGGLCRCWRQGSEASENQTDVQRETTDQAPYLLQPIRALALE